MPPEFGRDDLELEVDLGDLLLDLGLLLGQQFQLVLPFLAAALYSACFAARSASVSFLAITFSMLAEKAEAMSPSICPPSCSVTNGELNRPRRPVWNSGIACITFATRSMPSPTPEITCAAGQRLLLRLFLRVHQRRQLAF
jgi:hypothetical protein